MAVVTQRHESRVFSPDDARAIGQAFDAAWKRIQESPRDFALQLAPDEMREVLARRIIEVAQNGELDLTKLRDEALARLRSGTATAPN